MEGAIKAYSFRCQLNIADCVTIKPNASNYHLWKFQMEAYLSSQGLMPFVTGEKRQHSETTMEIANPNQRTWDQTDSLVMSLIFGTLSEESMSYVVGSNTAREVWLALAKCFRRSSFDLLRSLYTITKDGKSVAEYERELQRICDQLSDIGIPISESMKILHFLKGLGPDYEAFTTAIDVSMRRSPGPTYDDVVSQLNDFEEIGWFDFGYEARGFRGRGGYTSRDCGFSQQVFMQKTSYRSHRWNGSVSHHHGRETREPCQICGKSGHQALKCWYRFDRSYRN